MPSAMQRISKSIHTRKVKCRIWSDIPFDFIHHWASVVTKIVLACTKIPIVTNLVTKQPSLKNWIPCYFLRVKHLTSAWNKSEHKNDWNSMYWERNKLLASLMSNNDQMATCEAGLEDHMHNDTMHIKLLQKHNINICVEQWLSASERTILQ